MNFEEVFANSVRHKGEVVCMTTDADIVFFDISVPLTSTREEITNCSIADQNFLGNAINLLLHNCGVGDAGANDHIKFAVDICLNAMSSNANSLQWRLLPLEERWWGLSVVLQIQQF